MPRSWQLAFLLFATVAAGPVAAQPLSDPRREAQSLLEQAVSAYDDQGEPALAVGLLKRALLLDPSLSEAHLYLAVIHQWHGPRDRGRRFAEQELRTLLAKHPEHVLGRLHLALLCLRDFQRGYTTPAGPSKDTEARGDQAQAEFAWVLRQEPDNLVALDGYAAILSWRGGADEVLEARRLFARHQSLSPSDPEPYAWLADIAVSQVNSAEYKLRKQNAPQGQEVMPGSDSPPEELRKQFAASHGATVDEGIRNGEKAIELAPGWPQPAACLSILYRSKAQMASSEQERKRFLEKSREMAAKVNEVWEDLYRSYTPQPEPSPREAPFRLRQLAQLVDKRLYQRALIPMVRHTEPSQAGRDRE